MSAPKYCDDPDNCGYADCPTAFCDRNASTHSLHRLVPPHESEVIQDAQRKLVEVWLDGKLNEAGKILHAYKIGFDAGRAVRGNAKVSDDA